MWGSHHVSTHARIQTCRGCKRHGFCRMPLLAALGACRSVMKSAWVCTVQAPWRASTANAHLPSDSEDISPSEPSRRRRCPGASLPFSLCPKKKHPASVKAFARSLTMPWKSWALQISRASQQCRLAEEHRISVLASLPAACSCWSPPCHHPHHPLWHHRPRPPPLQSAACRAAAKTEESAEAVSA